MLQIIVAEYKLVSWEYFLDKMEMYELDVMLECLDNSVKQSWEQTRYQCHSTIQSQSSKRIEPTDVLQFAWDKKNDKKNTSVSNEDRERLTKKAKKIIEEKNKQ